MQYECFYLHCIEHTFPSLLCYRFEEKQGIFVSYFFCYRYDVVFKCVDGLFLLMVLSAPKRFRMYVVRFQECPVNFYEFHEFGA